ncbi:MAG: oxygen-independent coproporphyrinogen III oxidase [Gemmatimonadales bacterium]|jgi:oxygen-independent coproporphyrinogen-3 oxidase|nr:oxygen-independent coproporphyrinogen III oxidase [Gemmatimonadales bacterium]
MTGIPVEQVRRYDVPGPRYTSYPTVPAWTGSFGAAEYRAALEALAARPADSVTLYAHLPFCAYRCHYCGCNVQITSRTSVVDDYLDHLEREIELVTAIAGRGRRAVQLHLGGGTPNHLSTAELMRLHEMVAARFALADGGEHSVEADPRLVTREQLAILQALGFQRISFGVQDFDPVVQEAIGRVQPEPLVRDATQLARDEGFSGVNYDLIYGLPGQTAERWRATLDTTLAHAPDRIACYSYAHVPQARANQKLIDAAMLPGAEAKFRLFEAAVDAFTANGYEWVGMDHFARPDDELARAARERRLHRDFMGYTTRPAPHLLAFGMSAISDVAGCFAQNIPRTGEYERRVAAGDLPIERGYRLSDDDHFRRAAILHLMCNLELPAAMLPDAAATREALVPFVEDGLLEPAGDGYRATTTGRFFLRNVAMVLDAYLPKQLAGGRPVFSRAV